MHPPLCPGTEDWFGEDKETIALFIDGMGILDEYGTVARELVARYQCCAWQDRADRWQSIFRRSEFCGWLCGLAFKAGHEAREHAYAWREWERKGKVAPGRDL